MFFSWLVWLYQRVRPDIAHHVVIKLVIYGTLAAMAVSKTVVVNALAGLVFLFTGEAGSNRQFSARDVLCLCRRRRHVIVQNPTGRGLQPVRRTGRNLNLYSWPRR